MSTSTKGQPKWVQFVLGGLSGMMATCIVQPIDLIKTRMQLSGEGGGTRAHKSSLHAFLNIAKQEGLFNLYTGYLLNIIRYLPH